MNKILVVLALVMSTFCFSQEKEEAIDTLTIVQKEQQLDEVIITSTRIDLPFSKNSRTITVISSEEIKQSATTNVADVLQQVAGVDVRRRGTNGMQSDLYIRGGGFDQTLLLIDGIKVDDAQTGHHTMNMILPLSIIERIEIIKGPAARVFGQNAFTGAINIVTKQRLENSVFLETQAGSYGQKNAAVTVSRNLEKSSHLAHYSRNTSDGYRYNTDFNNRNYFIKSNFNIKNVPVAMLASLSERKFGANGFYASPAATNQYEETQTSLVGLTSTIKNKNFTIKPQLYWRRNQDMYVFVRQDPSIYRNLHLTNKVGVAVNTSYQSTAGITGFGVEFAKVYLASNNLGDRSRFMTNLFLEHRFKFIDGKLDVTPGIAVNYFSDFKFHAFPGIDMGYEIDEHIKVYGNVGYTYRIPTYTDLFYSDPTTLGNENLNPEEAISEEIGLKYSKNAIDVSVSLFNRDARKLIDYVKENEADLWEATNIRNVNTKGFETTIAYNFNINNYTQRINLGYSFLEDDVKTLDSNFSRYSINSLKHHFTATFTSKLTKFLSQNIIYKYAERTFGESYGIFDASVTYQLQNLGITLIANNIFNKTYTETNLVPMPKGNMLLSINLSF